MTEIRRSYWDRYYHEINRHQSIMNDRNVDYDPTKWSTQDFDQNPISGQTNDIA